MYIEQRKGIKIRRMYLLKKINKKKSNNRWMKKRIYIYIFIKIRERKKLKNTDKPLFYKHRTLS